MVPVWLQTPVGACEACLWDFECRGGLPLSIWCARRHLPLFDSFTVQTYYINCHILPASEDLYPCVHPPSPCINTDRLTRSHQRPYRCFLPAPALDALDQRPISAPSQTSPIWAAPCQLRKVAHVLFRPCCLFQPPNRGQKQIWGRRKSLSFVTISNRYIVTLVLRYVCVRC